VSSELRNYGSDQPRETDTGADRDITEVPAYAGSDTGISREDVYAELHGAGRDHVSAANGRTTDGSADADRGDTGADGSDSGQDHGNASADRLANGADDSAAPEGRDGDASADETGGDTRERPGLADNAETTDPDPTVRIPAETGFRGQNAADLPASERGIRVSSPDGQATDGPGHDDTRSAGSHDTGTAVLQGRDEGDTGKRSRTGPDAAEPAAQHADTAGAETAERKGKDQPARPESAPDASPGQPGETAAEAGPDQHGDDQRLAAIEQRLEAVMEQRLQTALDGVKADYDAKVEDLNAKVEDLKAEHESRTEGLKTSYEADKAQLQQEIGDLTAELETLKAGRQPNREIAAKPDFPTPGKTDVPLPADVRPEQHWVLNQEGAVSGKAAEKSEKESERSGWWSDAKAGLYGAVGSTVMLAGADQFIPGAPHAAIDLIVGGVTIAAAAVPVAREEWRKRKHGD
jgi:hypothetical protein